MDLFPDAVFSLYQSIMKDGFPRIKMSMIGLRFDFMDVVLLLDGTNKLRVFSDSPEILGVSIENGVELTQFILEQTNGMLYHEEFDIQIDLIPSLEMDRIMDGGFAIFDELP